jgi:hypothetical protein
MVLGVVVFTLAQNVSKTVVQAVAKAAHIDTSAMASRNPTEFQEAVLSVLESRNAPPKAAAPPPPNVALKELVPAVVPPQPVPTPQQAKESLETELLENQQARLNLQTAVGSKLNSNVGGIHIEFPKGGVQLDEPESAAVNAYIQKNPGADFFVESLVVQNAAVQSGGATEGRRKAYYRAMLIRQQMVASGVQADRISLQIRDAAPDVKVDIINVVTRSKVQK